MAVIATQMIQHIRSRVPVNVVVWVIRMSAVRTPPPSPPFLFTHTHTHTQKSLSKKKKTVTYVPVDKYSSIYTIWDLVGFEFD